MMVIIIISYQNFEANQKTAIIYLLGFGMALFKVERIWIIFVLVIVSVFAYLEYMTDDKTKLEIVLRFPYKLLDFFYQLFFQLHVSVFAASLTLLFLSHILPEKIYIAFVAAAILLLILCEHLVIAQPFKVKTVTELAEVFDKTPYYLPSFSDEARRRYEMLTMFEDKTYFSRSKSYSVISTEYFSLAGVNHKILSQLKKAANKKIDYLDILFHPRKYLDRGYSTPEMQLIRTIGVQRGYDKHVISRKVYEIVYSKVFLASYRKHIYHSGAEFDFFREYVLHVYLKNVMTKVCDIRYNPMCNMFDKPDEVEKWPMEALFIACLGLSFREVSAGNIALYQFVIDRYNLDVEQIYYYNSLLKQGKIIRCDPERKSRAKPRKISDGREKTNA